MIVDSTVPGAMRHATANDLILLITPGDSIRCGQWGISPAKPLADKYVLDNTEKNTIQTYITQYNTSIATLASQKGLAFVDMNSFMKSFKSGIVYNGIGLNATFVSGGGFSLDGVHPTPRGYALIANEFIKSINSKFGSTIPTVDVTKYNGVVFPK
jgi:lysophospholipase L1-like esterase